MLGKCGDTIRVHLCYVDDSGDSKRGTTLTALMIEAHDWSSVLNAWLDGRRAIHKEFGVPKTKELHASDLYKGRQKFCETPEHEAAFQKPARAAAGRIMLSHLAAHGRFTVATVASSTRSKPEIYARFVAWLEDWAVANDSWLMIFYDGQQGDVPFEDEITTEERHDLWETAIRNAAPYREVHRDLDIGTRRIVEDVIMQDSKYSQLIQAVDLLAYGAWHKHLQEHPEHWGTKITPHAGAIRAYMKVLEHWPKDSDYGVYWID